MKTTNGRMALLLGLTAICMPVFAQNGTKPISSRGNTIDAPDYNSLGADALPPLTNFNSPVADGRPGQYYFELGSLAFHDKDYSHAVDMYQVAASWAYKPAEYNLGLMYFRGEGVPADRARGAAWMVLAAERNTPLYVKARDLMITQLSNAEFAQTDQIWNQLKPTYGDEVALHRAKMRWAEVKASMTGSRVGDGAEHLLVGSSNDRPSQRDTPRQVVDSWTAFGATAADGSLAYRQFQLSDNPYDAIFLKGNAGTAAVGPLTPMKGNNKQSQKQPDANDHNF
ncbi:MAG TPA: sel1 repeat family protein [Rhodanobacteraceae bacterium]|nr:sel1 repeat family protein [Rhodanobacteraceae bacterium]